MSVDSAKKPFRCKYIFGKTRARLGPVKPPLKSSPPIVLANPEVMPMGMSFDTMDRIIISRGRNNRKSNTTAQ